MNAEKIFEGASSIEFDNAQIWPSQVITWKEKGKTLQNCNQECWHFAYILKWPKITFGQIALYHSVFFKKKILMFEFRSMIKYMLVVLDYKIV